MLADTLVGIVEKCICQRKTCIARGREVQIVCVILREVLHHSGGCFGDIGSKVVVSPDTHVAANDFNCLLRMHIGRYIEIVLIDVLFVLCLHGKIGCHVVRAYGFREIEKLRECIARRLRFIITVSCGKQGVGQGDKRIVDACAIIRILIGGDVGAQNAIIGNCTRKCSRIFRSQHTRIGGVINHICRERGARKFAVPRDFGGIGKTGIVIVCNAMVCTEDSRQIQVAPCTHQHIHLYPGVGVERRIQQVDKLEQIDLRHDVRFRLKYRRIFPLGVGNACKDFAAQINSFHRPIDRHVHNVKRLSTCNLAGIITGNQVFTEVAIQCLLLVAVQIGEYLKDSFFHPFGRLHPTLIDHTQGFFIEIDSRKCLVCTGKRQREQENQRKN